jgi:hypothetical protein
MISSTSRAAGFVEAQFGKEPSLDRFPTDWWM